MDGYFLIGDILGFGKIMENLDGQERATRVERWIELVEESSVAAGVERLQLISDTVFAAVEPTSEGLGSLVDFSRRLLGNGIQESFPLRGAICRGDFEWGRLIYGSAVIAAHELEVRQNWIGVACALGMEHTPEHWDYEKLVAYPVPFKSGPMKVGPAVSWEIPPADPLRRLLGHGGLAAHPEETIPWEVGEKLNNTIQFRTYVALLREHEASPGTFHGSMPMDAICDDLASTYGWDLDTSDGSTP